MLKNYPKNHVRFISYTGEYPCLCDGVLTLEIDGEEVKFGHVAGSYDWETEKYKDDNYDRFWNSGGCIQSDRDGMLYSEQAEWEIDVDDLPEQYRKYAAEIDREMNSNMPYGCCGGCI